MEIKWNNIKLSEVIIVGDFPYFKDDDVKICNLGFGIYRGVEVQKRFNATIHEGECYKTKMEALNIAKKHYDNYNKKNSFIDGNIPFEIIFYMKGIGWQVFTSNTINNERLVKTMTGKMDKSENIIISERLL